MPGEAIFLFPTIDPTAITVHRFAFGIPFAIIAVCLAVLVPLSSVRSPLLIAYGGLVLLLALLRAIFFCAFPYDQSSQLSAPVTYVYGAGFPLLNTSLVCLYFFVSEFVHASAKGRAHETHLRTKLLCFGTCVLEFCVQLMSDSLRLAGEEWSWTGSTQHHRPK